MSIIHKDAPAPTSPSGLVFLLEGLKHRSAALKERQDALQDLQTESRYPEVADYDSPEWRAYDDHVWSAGLALMPPETLVDEFDDYDPAAYPFLTSDSGGDP